MQTMMRSEPSVRRSVTMPAPTTPLKSSRRNSVAPSPEPQIETLYKHASVRIVYFLASSAPTTGHHLNISSSLGEAVGTLSWTSPLERLMAVGPLSIYKAPGSVAFISCGEVMHPILPKSQCWCVDDLSSKFVLQIRKPQYWRIEVPIAGAEDQGTSEQLKRVLSQVLLFEKTPCPFKRNFTVELPEAPTTPIKRRPWKPVHTPKSHIDETWLREAPLAAASGEESNITEAPDLADNQWMDGSSDAIDDTDATPRNTFHQSSFFPSDDQTITNEIVAERTIRSVTAPPQLTIITSSSSRDVENISPLSRSRSIESASSEYSSSVESFHTVQSWHSPITPLPPSPPESNPASPTTYPYPHDNIYLLKRPNHARELSEITITPQSPRVWEISRESSTESVRQISERHSTPPAKTPTKINDVVEEDSDEERYEIAATRPQQQIRHRPTTGSNSRRRALSPFPLPANIFSPSRRRTRRPQTARHLPTAIIQKTCEILLSPPSHLLNLMLEIAAKIAAGEWKGVVFGSGEGGEKIVGEWDYEDGESTIDSWGEDDYGISLGGNITSTSNAAHERGGRSWEVD